jgi:homoserine kinase
MDDYLHQPYRMPLLAFAQPLLATLREAGALASCWSGAGSAMLGITTSVDVDAVSAAARAFLDSEGLAGSVLSLRADLTGLVTR